MKDEALFLDNLAVIDAAVVQVCRRHHLTAAEADDFASEVRLHFIERQYEPLRRFEGRSSLRTYLTVCVQHLFLDYQNRLWGKWRPSAEARRLGRIGILVEKLVLRDGWTFDQVCELLRTNHHIEVDEPMQRLFVKIAERAPGRQIVGDVEADAIAGHGPGADANVLRAEQEFRAKQVQAALDRAKQTLTAEERLILKMRYEDAVPVADIARALHLNQKRLYRTRDEMLARLRRQLEADGIAGEEIAALLDEGALADVDRIEQEERDAAGFPQPAERTRTPWRKQ
ncbi:MAG TPA: sigma-70 family RNA polymerase sigma factor [Vicinamibacterales bacterium]|nr:sigma-70 family RNA polymerase sigma factor [Vicinamibacterales bacterium]